MRSSAKDRTLPLFPEFDNDRANARMTEMSNELEAAFRAAVTEARREIDGHLKVAATAISAAEAVSKYYGVPFSSVVSPIYNHYVPANFEEKWKEPLETAELADVIADLDVYENEYGNSGWEYSAAGC